MTHPAQEGRSGRRLAAQADAGATATSSETLASPRIGSTCWDDWSAGAEARVLFIQMKEESPWRPRGLLSHHRTHPFMSRIGFNNPLSSSSPPPGRHGGHLLCTEPEDQSARVGARGGVQSRSETQHEETHLDRHVGQLDPLARPTPDPADPASALHFSASLRVRRPKDVKAREKNPKSRPVRPPVSHIFF